MGIRFEVENMKEVQGKMRLASSLVGKAVDSGKKDTAEAILEEVERTSPVDTGRYKSNWDMVEKDDTVYIVNDTPYAKYLVFPNQHMVGSSKADVPSAGIQHNVRGIVKKHQKSYKEKVTTKVKGVLTSF